MRPPGQALALAVLRRWPSSIPPEAARWLDRRELVEVKVVDGLQGLGGGALLKVVGQGLEPRPILGLESKQDSDRILPAPSPAAAVGGAARR